MAGCSGGGLVTISDIVTVDGLVHEAASAGGSTGEVLVGAANVAFMRLITPSSSVMRLASFSVCEATALIFEFSHNTTTTGIPRIKSKRRTIPAITLLR